MVPAATYEVTIGDYDFTDVLRIETTSALETIYDLGEVQLDNADGNVPELLKGDPVQIRLGYVGAGTVMCLIGTATDVRRGRVVRVDVADPAYVLRTPVTRAWRNPDPGDIARAVLEPHGLALQMGSQSVARRPHWVAHGATGAAVLRGVARAWNLDWSLYFDASEGAIWWGPWASSPRVLKSKAAVMFTAPSDFAVWQPAEVGQRGHCTLALARPDLGHSTVLGVLDEAFGATPMVLRADRVRHVLEADNPKVPAYRTEVEWTRLV